MSSSTGLWLYRLLTQRGEQIAVRRLKLRVRRGREQASRAAERLGRTEIPRPEGPLVWLHTSGTGAARHIQELVQRMGNEIDNAAFLVTTTSGSSIAEIEGHFAPRTVHQYSPYELGASVHRFLAHWKPDIAFWTGSELWPRLIHETWRTGVPMYLIDARMSPETHYRWRWVPGFAADLLSRFDRILAAEAQTASFMRRLGVPTELIEVTGPLDEGMAPMPCNEDERDYVVKTLDGRPVWLAAHVLEDEIDAVLEAHSRASRHAHRLMLVLVPDPEAQGPSLAKRLTEEGVSVALRSDGGEPTSNISVYIADDIEEMGMWYRIAPITFLGNSLRSGGGVSPYGPASLGSAMIHGPNTRNYPIDYARFSAAGASRSVLDASELGLAVEELLMPDKSAALAHSAWECTSRGAEVTDQIIELMIEGLDKPKRSR